MGVTVSVADSHGLDMREIDFSSLLYADSYSRSSSIFSAHTGNWTDQFRGSGFKYDGNGYPTAGTVTSYAILSGGSRMVLISGFSIAAAKITSAAKTGSLSDDLAIIRDALAGNDNLNGGEFANYLRGYAGNDVISGGQYSDDLFGDDGDDKISGDYGWDNLYGGNGNDTLNGGAGSDELSGGAGSDTASYVGASEGVVASLKNLASNTNDASGDSYSSIENLTGTSYADTLEGNANANSLTGGNGNDRLIGRAGGDVLNGGAGTDSAYYYGATVGVIANLSNAAANTNDAAGDVYSSIESLVGSSYTDRLFGNGVANTLIGNGGHDSLVGYAGNDGLYGGAGADRLFGGTGADRFIFKETTESTSSVTDSIFDFLVSEQDRIDVSGIDARLSVGGDQAFVFIGTAAFSGDGSELRYERLASDTYIYADVDGDQVADLTIHLDDAITLTSGHFIL
ncbi:possible protease [Sinorhizobium fredii NGR234]|uniref:Possible protease n=1 Tax=Sinorhizobium fredii (strain NBRC 101917 / NGR234) TaxID=394 RepID=C3MAT5_SINFN|nr:calcium-binding protein [Sinorhizobium fredii]ACP24928.1 possible protease [Sinorhizobium fredii NGR234]